MVAAASRWMDFRPRHPRPVRLPAGTAPWRPRGLHDLPQGRGERAGGAAPAGGSQPTRCTSSRRCHASSVPRLPSSSPGSPVPGPAGSLPESGCSDLGADHRDRARRRSGQRAGTAIGIAEADLRPVRVDFHAEPHFLLFGDAESGKSTFLRGLAATITARFRPDQARVILVDYRRSLLGAVETEHLIGTAPARLRPPS